MLRSPSKAKDTRKHPIHPGDYLVPRQTNRLHSFYYGDERLANGDFVGGAISGIAHAERYWELSQDRKQRPWMDTFVAGQGYKEFPKV